MSIRLGAVGLGGLGTMQLYGVADRDDVEIVAGADVARTARENFEDGFDAPAYADYEAMLDGEDLDAVTIVTPHTLHYEQTRACLERDLHVLLEKPMVTGTRDAVDLVRRAREHDLVLQVGYQRHLHPGYRAVRETLQSGEIGDVHMASCYLAQDWISGQEGAWRTDPELSGGGQLIDSGSHLLDALLWTTDSEAREVAAVMDYRDHDVDVNTALSATLEGPDGPITASVGISADGTGFEEGLVVWGTDGYLRFGQGELTVFDGGGDPDSEEFDAGDYQEQTAAKVAAFLGAVRGERENPVPGEYGLRVTALTEAAYRARESGETVDVRALVADAREEVGE
ncbi:MAG: Gfo/Idh/MocA family oxidoreductase [Haloarculaceae archaeon]